MKLTTAQSEIARDTHRFRVVNCGRRFGKTFLAVNELAGKAVSGNDKNLVYIAPTFQQARDIAWNEIKKIILPVAININESRLEITVKTIDGGNSRISLRGWEAIETLRGQKFDMIVIDEIASMRNFFLYWQEVIRPTLTDTKGEVLFISTPKGFNHFYDLFNLQDKDRDFKSFHFTSYDNPHLPKDEIDKAKQEMTDDKFSQEYMAEFRKMEGLVYKEFIRELHIYDDKEIREVNRMVGVDFGFRNPAAVLLIKKDFDNKFYVTDEWYKTEQTDEQIIEVAKALSPHECYPDPENPQAIEKMKLSGLNVRDVFKTKDSIKAGIDRIRELFKQNRLFINRKCTNLIHELEMYHYDEWKPEGEANEKPIKEKDHALDALRYVILMTYDDVNLDEQSFDGGLYSQSYS